MFLEIESLNKPVFRSFSEQHAISHVPSPGQSLKWTLGYSLLRFGNCNQLHDINLKTGMCVCIKQ